MKIEFVKDLTRMTNGVVALSLIWERRIVIDEREMYSPFLRDTIEHELEHVEVWEKYGHSQFRYALAVVFMHLKFYLIHLLKAPFVYARLVPYLGRKAVKQMLYYLGVWSFFLSLLAPITGVYHFILLLPVGMALMLAGAL